MNPKPFSALNHFTVPVAMSLSCDEGVFQARAARPGVAALTHSAAGQRKMRPKVTYRQAHTTFMGTKTATFGRLARNRAGSPGSAVFPPHGGTGRAARRRARAQSSLTSSRER